MVSGTSAPHAPEVTQHAEVCLSAIVVASSVMILSLSGCIGQIIIETILYPQLNTCPSEDLKIKVSWT